MCFHQDGADDDADDDDDDNQAGKRNNNSTATVANTSNWGRQNEDQHSRLSIPDNWLSGKGSVWASREYCWISELQKDNSWSLTVKFFDKVFPIGGYLQDRIPV